MRHPQEERSSPVNLLAAFPYSRRSKRQAALQAMRTPGRMATSIRDNTHDHVRKLAIRNDAIVGLEGIQTELRT